MLEAVRRNAVLCVLCGLTVAVYCFRTLPAKQRSLELRRTEQRTEIELERLAIEAERMRQNLEALETRDPATLSRVIIERFRLGGSGIDALPRAR